MLVKLTSVSPYARLALCLVLSMSFHGGLAFYDWDSAPGGTLVGGKPVVVSLMTSYKTFHDDIVDQPRVLQKERKPVVEVANQKKPAPTKPIKNIVTALDFQFDETDVQRRNNETARMATTECIVEQERVCEAELKPGQDIQGTQIQPTNISYHQSSKVGPADVSATNTIPLKMASGVDASGYDVNTTETVIEAVPDYLNNPLPEYPFIARQKRWEGVVWLLVKVTAKGNVADTQIEESCGYRVLDRAASKTVKHWEFTPAMRAGLPVESQVRIPVRFQLEES